MPPVIMNITYQTRAGDSPVLGSVFAEELIKITGFGFASNAQVRADELAVDSVLRKQGSSTATEIRVFLPSVRAMETSSGYKRNAIVTNLTIVVENPDEDASEKLADSWVLPILLGPPHINGSALIHGKEVSFGNARGGIPVPTDQVDDLGGPGGPGLDDGLGQVWFYPRAPELPPLPAPTKLPGAHGSLTLPAALVSQLSHIRKSGTRLKVAQGQWDDDRITAELPHKPIAGTIIVWRDDIPSKPVHIVSLLPIGVTCDQVQTVLAQMFSLTPDPTAGPVLLQPGQTLYLNAIPLPTSALNQVVVNLINSLTVEFTFKLSGLPPNDPSNPNNPNNAYKATPNVDVSNPQPSSLPTGTILVRPDLFPAERGAPASKLFTVQLVLRISFADCGTIQANVVKTLQCEQLPLGIPTIGVFFEDDHFNGSPMIVVPKETKLIDSGKEIDDNHSDGLVNARSTLGSALQTLATTLDLLSFFATAASIPGAEEISLVSLLVDKINAAGHLVINSTGKMDDLEDAVVISRSWWLDDDFDDAASSFIMIGSAGLGTLKGFLIKAYEDSDQHGLRATLSLPSDRIVAALPDFENMSLSHTVNGIVIAQPYGGSTSPADDFDDDMSSLEFVSN